MRTWQKISFGLVVVLAALSSVSPGQDEGPKKDFVETVAKPRKKDAPDSEQPKIPSKLSNKNKADLPPEAPSFKVDTSVVSVDVSILDNKGHFIPGIPKGNFRILEDNVPQQIKGVNMGEAPLTVAMVIEFSNKFQRYWGSAWYQTLQLAWAFASTLKPADY